MFLVARTTTNTSHTNTVIAVVGTFDDDDDDGLDIARLLHLTAVSSLHISINYKLFVGQISSPCPGAVTPSSCPCMFICYMCALIYL